MEKVNCDILSVQNKKVHLNGQKKFDPRPSKNPLDMRAVVSFCFSKAVTQPKHGRRAPVSAFCPIPKKPAINFIFVSSPLLSKIKSV